MEITNSIPIDNQYITQKAQTPADAFDNIKTRILEVIDNIISQDEISFDERLNDKFLELDFGAEFDIDAAKIGVNDAIFFVNLLNQQNLINYSVEDNNLSVSSADNKKIDATNSLLSMLQTSYDTKKPIRLDFDNNITVILKLDKDGKIQAHFIPGTSEVESYLKNNIQSLKQVFDDEEINYSYLGYSKSREERKNKKRSNK